MAGKTFFSLKFHCPVWQTSLLLVSLKAKREKQRAGHTQPAAEKQIISDEPQFSGYKKELKSQLYILRSVCPSPGSEEIETLKEKFCFLWNLICSTPPPNKRKTHTPSLPRFLKQLLVLNGVDGVGTPMEERNEKQYIPETLAKINRRELLQHGDFHRDGNPWRPRRGFQIFCFKTNWGHVRSKARRLQQVWGQPELHSDFRMRLCLNKKK